MCFFYSHVVFFLDDSGRYSYKAQPSICRWNCGKLAEALAPVLSLERSRKILEKFDEQYQHAYVEKMRKKVRTTVSCGYSSLYKNKIF